MSDEQVEERLLRAEVDADLVGWRLDQALAALFPDYSRSRIQVWIREGRVTVDGKVRAQRHKVSEGERLVLRAVEETQIECVPQAMPLRILFEDEHLLVIDKAAGLVVHPAAGNPDGTLQNGLLYHDSSLARLPRAGIVHRLDKDTSGLMVVARSEPAYQRLVEALARREIHREYRALVVGRLRAPASVDQPIGRHPTVRTRMAVNPLGKPAVTHYEPIEAFHEHTLLRVCLETGRTHQIRVHMVHIRHPVFGDPVYGGRLQLPSGADEDLKVLMRGFGRQALHARRLILRHPVDECELCFDAPIPRDMGQLLGALRCHREAQETLDLDPAFYMAPGETGWETDGDED